MVGDIVVRFRLHFVSLPKVEKSFTTSSSLQFGLYADDVLLFIEH